MVGATTMDAPAQISIARPGEAQDLRCVICNQLTARLVDGQPSCDYHANQVYEQQWEDYVRQCVY